MNLRRVVVPVFSLLLAACAGNQGSYGNDGQSDRLEPIVVRVSGFGTYEDVAADRRDPRKRLMARRASQLDAYRNLAERVYGTVIYGNSTVSEFVMGNDMFRAYVDSYIRGAEKLAVNEHSDGVIETVLELKLAPHFQACAAEVADELVRDLCPIPMPLGDDRAGGGQSRSADSLYYLD